MATLADPSRFQILCELAAGPRHVSDLARLVGLSQSCTTRHVQALARVGSVECRREGKRVMVSVRGDDEVTRSLLGWIAATGEPAVDPGRGPVPIARPEPPPRAAGTGGATGRARAGRKELPPVHPTGSGTPSGHSDRAQPSASHRPAALEDFLL